MTQETKKPTGAVYFNEELDNPDNHKTLQPVEPDSSEEEQQNEKEQ